MNRGFALLEIVVALAILLAVITAALESLQAGQTSCAVSMRRSTAHSNARRALIELTDELRMADPRNVIIAGGVDFRVNTGFRGGAIVWSADPVVYFVDKGALMRRSGGTLRQVCPDVVGFEVLRGTSRALLVRLTVVSTDALRQPVPLTLTTTIQMRLP
jgi:prepilin-type N-terminal cleavage/methylation domain-containing protein